MQKKPDIRKKFKLAEFTGEWKARLLRKCGEAPRDSYFIIESPKNLSQIGDALFTAPTVVESLWASRYTASTTRVSNLYIANIRMK